MQTQETGQPLSIVSSANTVKTLGFNFCQALKNVCHCIMTERLWCEPVPPVRYHLYFLLSLGADLGLHWHVLLVRTNLGTNFCFNETLTLHKPNFPSISLASVVVLPPASGCCTAFLEHPRRWIGTLPSFTEPGSWVGQVLMWTEMPSWLLYLRQSWRWIPLPQNVFRGHTAQTGVKTYVWSTSQFTGSLCERRGSNWNGY